MNKIIKKWWSEIDVVSFVLSLVLLIIGIILSLTGTTEIRSFDYTFFIKRHLFFSTASIFLVIFLSFQNSKFIRRFSALGLFATLILMCLVLIFGNEINGSKRWMFIFGLSIQPSEFLKPFFAVVSAWFLTKGLEGKNIGFKIVFTIFLLSSCLLILQPDFGMTILFMVVFFAQLFVSGLSIIFVLILVVVLLIVGVLSYYNIENVKNRIDIFIDPLSGDTYQIEQSIKAFKSGGI